MPSSPIITLSKDTLKIDATATVTINFVDSWVNVLPNQLTSPDGKFTNLRSDDEGRTWTASFSPNENVTTTNSVITLDAAVNGGATSSAFTVDTVAPGATIFMDDINLTTGEQTTIHVNFSEKVTGVGSNMISAPNGQLSAFTTSDGGTSWAATFTPNAGVNSSSNTISYSFYGVTDLAGNVISSQKTSTTGFDSNGYYAIDTTGPAPGPTATIVVDETTLGVDKTAGVTITFSEHVRDFGNEDVTVGSGSLSTLKSDDEGKTWHGTLTPGDGVETSGNLVKVDLSALSGASSTRPGTGFAESNAYRVDTKLPTATIVMDDDAIKLNETSKVTITFSEAVTDLSSEDFEVEGGTLSNPMHDEGVTSQWTATFTPTENYQGSGKYITLDYSGVKDYAGNAGVGSVKSNAFAVDTVAPTAKLKMADSMLTTGEKTTVTVTFSEKVKGMGDGAVIAAVGSLSTFESSDDGLTWSATFTPPANHKSVENLLMFSTNGITDLAGNTISNINEHIGYYSIDTTLPLPVPTAKVVVDQTSLSLNRTAGVTITFSEAVRNFDNTDVTVAGGTLSQLKSDDEGVTWKGTLTAKPGLQSVGGKVSVDLAGVTGAVSGNAGTGHADSNPFWIDTKAPTATVVVADDLLTEGETSLVTISFSEYVTNFEATDLKAENGTLGKLSSSDEGRTWTTTFTPSTGVKDSSNVILLNMQGVSDHAGNPGAGVVQSNNYAVNTAPPVVVVPPPVPPVTVDGVAIKTDSVTAADGSKIQLITVPTVASGRVDKDGAAALADIPLVKNSDGKALLSVGVPVGFGLTASGSTTAKGAGDSLAHLIAEIKAHTVIGSQSQDSMTGGGTGFLGALDASTPLLVQTIVLDAPVNTNMAKQALLISAMAAEAGGTKTALVIDALRLPDGATIELQNVDFAAIVGNVTVRGGDGKQIIFGDSGSQNIMLGADDDILHGGAGNDIIGSAGGNDQIFGDEGDDIVFGGEGDDYIDGGTGTDIVQLMGASRDDYSFRVADGKLVMTHLDGGLDGTDVVSNVEILRFTGGAADVDVAFRDTDVASLVRMYDTVFGRNPDEAGLNFWIGSSEAGMSLHDIALAMVSSAEAQVRYQGMDDADFIAALYLQGLDRTGTAQESAFWIDVLESGAGSRADALLGFADSAEKIALVGLMDTSIVTAIATA